MADKFTVDVMAVLRADNKRLESKNRSLLSQVAKLENQWVKLEQRALVAEDVREALYDAIRVLAEQVGSKTASGRKAREGARNLLERADITPPGTLGSSRVQKKKRKRRKRKS